jgi:hypothetical protein
MGLFTFGKQMICTLNVISQKQEFILSAGEKNLKYSFEQLEFLSPRVFAHFMESREPFQINVQPNQCSEFINCFDQIDSLLRSSNYL